MKNNRLSVIIITVLAVCVSSTAFASNKQLNVRQSIGNGSMNKISAARLQGMLTEGPKETTKSTKEFGRRGCVTSIGNQQSGSSLMGKPQDVNIIGDVTNVCL